MKIRIKPLSVNKCWQGRRFKTPEYKAYERTILLMLPNLDVPKNIKLELIIKVGYSSNLADVDNMAKPFIDILQKKYSFNDNQIFKLVIIKEIVKKGNEYINFNISEYSEIKEMLDNPPF